MFMMIAMTLKLFKNDEGKSLDDAILVSWAFTHLYNPQRSYRSLVVW